MMLKRGIRKSYAGITPMIRNEAAMTARFGVYGTLPTYSALGRSFSSTPMYLQMKKSEAESKKLTIWDKVKKEARHYWDGTKLLGFEIKISSRILMKSMTGYALTRREMLQLKRTISDIIRLVPFAAFVLIPFAELLLPIALKIFPNMLPSTYESRSSKQKKLDNLRKTRELVSEIMRENKTQLKPTGINEEQKTVFNSFYEHVRATGEPESREQLVTVARMFTDDTVLDNLTRPHLVAMAKYMNLQPFGTDVMLRYRIRYKMLQLKNDDVTLYYEGLDQLNEAELKMACASRGIRSAQVEDEVKLRESLRVWLSMRLKEKIPSTLLVLATAYNYGEVLPTNIGRSPADSAAESTDNTSSLYDALCDVLSGIPDELYHEVKVNVVHHDEPAQKLNQLKEQAEIMREEEQQEKNELVHVQDKLSLDELDPVQEKK
ncbi:LETM1 domain-containing protein YLH47, mitochondrial [Nakaseomyces glabratus]|uniref:LETM1 domain-containing protein YLH47, mitochondrial n=1 Tax=Candida glabrata TaxID=5478 RepID=A0A0W0CD50_CANGB|nr:Letm1 ribosome-binding (RBD) domain profile [Nakaseomyces glabratus]KAH7590675.1 Letm1 ribosome-binding (RBD) domain profile [Nakaseomyces glabratus]KAH7596705.1 Letm1 ribosome-binding (RBD) domain profile [Nakaseomyces glabratus]KAH7606561.1 Letm1 ribosome-binding (RBD) domain profile [Nakaseomyces glabratus]KAH7614703.1 Letm1 ribosome-binding (RBD) domain profile [Nakaseomyces glabratus]